MVISTSGPHHKFQTNNISLVMEQTQSHNDSQHVIDITSSSEYTINQPNSRLNENVPSTSMTTAPVFQHPFSIGNGGNSSFVSRESRMNPLNSGYWISFELVITMSQIIAAIVVLCLSRDERPEAPLFTWVIGYASGCVATLPLLFWRFYNRTRQDPSQNRQSITASSNATTLEGDSGNVVTRFLTTGLLSARVRFKGKRQKKEHPGNPPSGRLKVLIEYFKMSLDCFFAVWFVVGNVWIFGGHSSSSDAPNLYRLCIVFLSFSCVGYAMPFILCATICCCLPCIISVVGYREDPTHNKGATTESINSLPIYKFKIKKNKSANDKETNLEGGIVAAGTEKEHAISGEDAVCCICLAKYANNDELRELPCSHFLHKNCVDKWLKINASCPLCKTQVGKTVFSLQTDATATRSDLR